MPDIFSKEKRSKIMSAIRAKDTVPELLLAAQLKKISIRGFRKHPKLVGTPDIAFMHDKLAIFVDGDFWHGFDWKSGGHAPKKGFWQQKIAANITRDKRVGRELRKLGWSVLRFWEHRVIGDPDICARTVKKRLEKIRNPEKIIRKRDRRALHEL